MSATILKFPLAARKLADRKTATVAQPLSPGANAPECTGAGALSNPAVLERQINHAHERLIAARDPKLQQLWFGVMKTLCGLRSRAKIEAMEKERGLR